MKPDLREYAQGWRRELAQAERAATERGRRARALLPELVEVLVAGWHPGRIWLIGSLASGRFHGGSDIDLVAEGLPAGGFYHACAALDRVAGEFVVDLVPLESARPFVREQLDAGAAELLYDATRAR
jgi:predicted nucleotidyltransferase